MIVFFFSYHDQIIGKQSYMELDFSLIEGTATSSEDPSPNSKNIN